MDTVLERKQKVSDMTGIAVDRLHCVKMELNTLREQGILIDLNISGTRMFNKTATWAETGIQGVDDPRLASLTRGQKYLIPKEQVERLASIEARMRQWLKRLSFQITGFSPYVWLPFTAYETWSEKWAELTGELVIVKGEIISMRDEYVDLLADQMMKVAEAAWRSITAQGYELAIVDHKPYDHAQFVAMVVSSAVAQMPSVEKIEKELKADYITGLVYGAEDVAQDRLNAEKIIADIQIERERQKSAMHQLHLQEKMVQEEYDFQHARIEMEKTEKELKIEAMMQAEAEHARQQLREIASPFQEVFSELRNRFAQDAEEMLAAIKKNGFVRGKTAERASGLVEMFDLLAVQDDFELRERLKALREAIGPMGAGRSTSTHERNTDEVISILEEIKTLSHMAVKDLMNGPSRFSNLE